MKAKGNVQDAWARWKIGILEGLIARLTSTGQEVEFSYAGAVAVSTSTPWAAAANCTANSVRALLGTAGSSSTVVTVYVNGSSIGTVTLTSGQTNVGAALTTTVVAQDTDVVTVAVTTAGTGAADLTVLLRVA